MNKKVLLVLLLLLIGAQMVLLTSCAGIIPPSGGPRDTIPPKLVMSIPHDSAKNVKSQKLVLTFDEFVELKEVSQNVIFSPNPKKTPLVEYKLKNITIKLRDSLEPNTTYSINFGNGIKDINEGNILKDFTYLFSTGNKIANGTFSGKAILAETGRTDSTLIVILHKNLNDTAIYKSSPRYIAKIDGKGNFIFRNIEVGSYNAFVLPNDYTKRYDDSTKLFGFMDSIVVFSDATPKNTFYVYQEEKIKEKPRTNNSSNNNKNGKEEKKEDKKLKYSSNLEGISQDLLGNLQINFNRKLKSFDSTKITLCDTFYNPLSEAKFSLDTGNTFIKISYPWREAQHFRLVMQKEVVYDTNGTALTKGDTLKFITRNESDYGSLRLKFMGLDLSKHPVLQILSNDRITESVPLTGDVLKRKLFRPGDYTIRILLDQNQNGIWDAGNYKKKLQPEIVLDKNWKLNIKGNWDNETDVKL